MQERRYGAHQQCSAAQSMMRAHACQCVGGAALVAAGHWRRVARQHKLPAGRHAGRMRRLTPAVGERSHNPPAQWIVLEAILCNKPASAPAHMQAPCGAVQRAPAPATHCACGWAQDVGPTAHCEQAPSSEPAGALDPKEWRSFRVMSKEPVTKNTQQLRCGGTLQNRARCTVARS